MTFFSTVNTQHVTSVFCCWLLGCSTQCLTEKAVQLQYSRVQCIQALKKRRQFCFSFLKFEFVTSCGWRSVYTNNSLICANRAIIWVSLAETGCSSSSHFCFVLYAVRSACFNIKILPALALRKGRVLHKHFSCSDLGWLAGYRCVSSDFRVTLLPSKFNIRFRLYTQRGQRTRAVVWACSSYNSHHQLANTTALSNGPIASAHGDNLMMPSCAAARLQYENPLVSECLSKK